MGTFCCLPSALWWHLKSSRMWRILVSSLLVAQAAGQGSGFSSALTLADGYLPPGGPDNPTPNVVRCEQPKTFYKTETQRIVNTVVKTVLVTVPQVIQKTAVVTKVVPSTILVTSIQQVKSPVVRTQIESSIVNRVSTITVQGPGRTSVLPVTQSKEQISYKTEQRVVQRTVTVTTPQVRYSTVVQRITKTITERVPQVVYVTKVVQVPGRNVVVTKTEKRRITSVQPYQPPARTSIKNEIAYVTSVVVRQIPGPVINKVNNIVRTEIVEQTSVKRVPQISTQIVPQNKEVLRTVTETKTVSRVQVRTIVRTEQVPVLLTKTVKSYITVPLVLTSTSTVLRTVPGPDVVRSVIRTDLQVATVRGQDRVITDLRTISSVLTNIVRTTVIRPRIVTKEVVKTEKCDDGYHYDAPKNPFNF
ncbi:uncharacterized protein LOC122394162 isoform X2 [Amphibalanus amphitrite]|uniref:uncharacterized protein LOC122394162 isoform X2 n=1 Tax=Amphibalanus amphitrite TaxID=1232801 RepID=UPI001C911A6E|nr:uncharacterized protein LOC122394162 isoform X2 [Amphibalanus amphitrite]